MGPTLSQTPYSDPRYDVLSACRLSFNGHRDRETFDDSGVEDVIKAIKGEKTYKAPRAAAIGTGVAAIVALAAVVALAILFPPLGFVFVVGGAIAGAAFLSLAVTSIVKGVEAAKTKSKIEKVSQSISDLLQQGVGGIDGDDWSQFGPLREPSDHNTSDDSSSDQEVF